MATYRLIESYTVAGSSTTNIAFTGIPNTYTDLCLWISARTNNGGTRGNLRVFLNSTTSGYYQQRFIAFDGNSQAGITRAGVGEFLAGAAVSAASGSNIFSYHLMYLGGYKTNKYKVFGLDCVTPNNSASVFAVEFNGGMLENSAAISTIDIDEAGGTFLANTTAYLYGISNA